MRERFGAVCRTDRLWASLPDLRSGDDENEASCFAAITRPIEVYCT